MVSKRRNVVHLIYLLTNVETNERYVGLTIRKGGWKKSLLNRFKQHCARAANEPDKRWKLLESIRAHGADTFDVELIDVVRGKARAHAVEAYHINAHNATLNEG
jgi:hypothetical protein